MRFQVDTVESLRLAYRVLPDPERATNHDLLTALCVSHQNLNVVTDTALFERNNNLKPPQWKAGMMVSFETEDGWERGVEILGMSESGDAAEMSVKFVDGTVDDWETAEFMLDVPQPTETETSKDRTRPSPNSKTGYLFDGVHFCDEAITAAGTFASATSDAAGRDNQQQRIASGLKAAHQNKGIMLFHLGRVAEAWAATDLAVRMDPAHQPLTTVVEDANKAVATAAGERLTSWFGSSSFESSPSSSFTQGVEGKLHMLWPASIDAVAMDASRGVGLGVLPIHQVSSASKTIHGIPVWVSRLTQTADKAAFDAMAAMNKELVGLVHALHEKDPRGNSISNVGGWQSGRTVGEKFKAVLQESAGISAAASSSQSEVAGGDQPAGSRREAARILYAHVVEELSRFIAVVRHNQRSNTCSK
jgi:hypothetical protein